MKRVYFAELLTLGGDYSLSNEEGAMEAYEQYKAGQTVRLHLPYTNQWVYIPFHSIQSASFISTPMPYGPLDENCVDCTELMYLYSASGPYAKVNPGGTITLDGANGIIICSNTENVDENSLSFPIEAVSSSDETVVIAGSIRNNGFYGVNLIRGGNLGSADVTVAIKGTGCTATFHVEVTQ